MQIDKRIQQRDIDAVNFINMTELCTRSQIQEIIYPKISESVCIRRLKLISELKLASRSRFNIDGNSNQYVYYRHKTRKPSKRILTHDLMITQFIVELIKASINIVDVERSTPIGKVIPDALITIQTNTGATKRLLLEVQLSGEVKNCVLKYQGFKNEVLKNRKEWGVMPQLIVVSDLEGSRPTLKDMKVKYTDTNMKDLRTLIFS